MMRRHKRAANFSSSQRDRFVNRSRHQSCCIEYVRSVDVSILNPIIGLIAFSFFSIIVLPLAVVIFFLGLAGLAGRVGEHKKLKRSQTLQILAVAEQT
jgi:hypothetical protein